MHIAWNKMQNIDESQGANNTIQSAKDEDLLPPKCNFCTLGEIALLRIVKKNPFATQKEIAEQIGKSERTIKTITVTLQKKDILRRANGKRNGYWEIMNE